MSEYDAIANEYYDPRLHPTCNNFGELSEQFLVSRIRRFANDSRILEVGAGRSIVAPVVGTARLMLLDSSRLMLAYSRSWIERGAMATITDARETGLAEAQFGLVVASLGDPYNQLQFWREMARILRRGGYMLFTSPSPAWADRFRSADNRTGAEFVLKDGSRVMTPSYIPSVAAQKQMMDEAEFEILEHKDATTEDISGPISPKLQVFSAGDRPVVLHGFALQRR